MKIYEWRACVNDTNPDTKQWYERVGRDRTKHIAHDTAGWLLARKATPFPFVAHTYLLLTLCSNLEIHRTQLQIL